MSTLQDIPFKHLKINKLPALPHVLTEILDACQSNTANFLQISKIINRDAVIAAKVIALANSGSYFQRQKVATIDRALMLIGVEHIKTMVITIAVQQFFSGFSNSQNEYLKTLWTRSLNCALLAKSFSALTSYPQPEKAYLTGLLHHIGELVLRTNYPDEYDNQQGKLLDSDEAELIKKENERLRTDHCEVGAWLLEHWGLGEFASAAVKHHHEPVGLLLDAHQLVKVVYLASQLSSPYPHTKDLTMKAMEAAGKLFALRPALVTEIINNVRTEVAKVAESLQIQIITDHADADKRQRQDDQKQLALGEQIKNISLLLSAKDHLDSTGTLTEVSRAIEETAFMLFGYPSARLFLADAPPAFLTCQNYQSDRQQTSGDEDMQLQVPLQQESSLIATAFIQDKVLSSVQWQKKKGKLPVIDQHVLKMLGAPHMICVPIRRTSTEPGQNKLAGLLTIGCSQPPSLSDQSRKMLKLFADNAGRRFHQLGETMTTDDYRLSQQEQQQRLREICHEANNPLTIIGNYLDILSGKLTNIDGTQQDITIIREEIDRVSQILMQLADMSTSKEEPAGVDINQEINDLVNLFTSSLFLTHDIQCHVSTDPKLKRQAGLRNYVKQILLNLIKNAVEAMPDGGDIYIHTIHKVNFNNRQYVEISISDTGPGLTEEALLTLFEPGTSTKSKDHSGLGLSITRNLINELQGTISCHNTDRGTQFQILLPAKELDKP